MKKTNYREIQLQLMWSHDIITFKVGLKHTHQFSDLDEAAQMRPNTRVPVH
jgi:hypothetical protein